VANVLLLNGPNLNLLGTREPQHYGHENLADIEKRLVGQAQALGHTLTAFQSNHEGVLIDHIQHMPHEHTDFLLFNPGGYTHTSVALRDAVSAVKLPFIEIHLSNIQARESFRQQSLFSDLAVGVISGLGPQGYELALLAADRYLNSHKT
jgi:3-dehydroquinate dehydratase II